MRHSFASAHADRDGFAMLALEVRKRVRRSAHRRGLPARSRPTARSCFSPMDISTMIGQECIDELADLVGMKEHYVSAITERAMRGEIAFEPALRERVALLKGLDAGVVAQVIEERIR